MTSDVLNANENVIPRGIASVAVDERERREERAMLMRCAAGDDQAIRWVMNRYRDRVVRLAAHVLHNPREAEDIAQEAFVKAFRQVGSFRGDASFYGWLYRIVVNLCLDKMRRKCMTAEMPLDESTLPTITANCPDMDKRLAVLQILDTLTPPMRAALVLREVEGLDYAEIAGVLDIPVGTVRSRLNTAREQFRKRWTAAQEEADDV